MSKQDRRNLNISDSSQENVVNIANTQYHFRQFANRGRDTINIDNLNQRDVRLLEQETREILIDREVINLLNWLAVQQGIDPEIALKKAVVTAAYLQDIKTNQGGKILVQRQDKSIKEINL